MIRPLIYNGIDLGSYKPEGTIPYHAGRGLIYTGDPNLCFALISDEIGAPDLFFVSEHGEILFDTAEFLELNGKKVIFYYVSVSVIPAGCGYFRFGDGSDGTIYSQWVDVYDNIDDLPKSTYVEGWNIDNRNGYFLLDSNTQYKFGARFYDSAFDSRKLASDENIFPATDGRDIILTSDTYQIEHHKFGAGFPMGLGVGQRLALQFICSCQYLEFDGVRMLKKGDWAFELVADNGFMIADFVRFNPDLTIEPRLTDPTQDIDPTPQEQRIFTEHYTEQYQ